MSALRRVARNAARGQSYKKEGTTDMFEYFFTKMWREKGNHPASINKYSNGGPCKKGHKPVLGRI